MPWQCSNSVVLRRIFLRRIAEESVSKSQIMADEALLLRAQVRIHLAGHVFLFVSGPARKTIPGSVLLEWN